VKTHADNVFVTRDLYIWPFEPKLNGFHAPHWYIQKFTLFGSCITSLDRPRWNLALGSISTVSSVTPNLFLFLTGASYRSASERHAADFVPTLGSTDVRLHCDSLRGAGVASSSSHLGVDQSLHAAPIREIRCASSSRAVLVFEIFQLCYCYSGVCQSGTTWCPVHQFLVSAETLASIQQIFGASTSASPSLFFSLTTTKTMTKMTKTFWIIVDETKTKTKKKDKRRQRYKNQQYFSLDDIDENI